MIKVAVAGLGRMGISHVAIANSHPDVEIVGVCDVSQFVLGALQQYSSFACFDNYDKMIEATEPDGVIIATPTSSHAEILHATVVQGRHIFVEKPFCPQPEDSCRLAGLAKQHAIVNQVGYHLRFLATFNEAKRLLDDQVIGDVYHFQAETYGPLVLNKSSSWRGKKSEAGGCLYDYASHAINLVNYLIGMPESVRGSVLKHIYSTEVEDAVYSTLNFANGVTGQLAVNWSDETYRKMEARLTILGSAGKIVVDRQECRIYLRHKNEVKDLSPGWNIKYTTELTNPVWYYLRGEEFSAQIDYFVEQIRTKNDDNINSFASAAETDVVIDMIKQDAMSLH
ncbi:MAG: oxidoreductase [Candidatus Entotheonella gemina]|uniref:Oxidoreductase n=1 Tax=Candidatus Entotheonella gemina TaxID=1429439 RepID=W4MA88_9BACT|nr:MAG: oxidoreductase [Candidatus Entotheonella gemina]